MYPIYLNQRLKWYYFRYLKTDRIRPTVFFATSSTCRSAPCYEISSKSDDHSNFQEGGSQLWSISWWFVDHPRTAIAIIMVKYRPFLSRCRCKIICTVVHTGHRNLQMQTAFRNTIRIPQVRTRSSEIRFQSPKCETVLRNWNCIPNKRTINSIKRTVF